MKATKNQIHAALASSADAAWAGGCGSFPGRLRDPPDPTTDKPVRSVKPPVETSGDLPLCVRIDADDKRSREALLGDGWREIEVLETWLWDEWVDPPEDHEVREAEPRDAKACELIALESFGYDRLHKDSSVPKDIADSLKLFEIIHAFGDEETLVLVVIEQGEGTVVGFVTFKFGRIGLIAVDRISRKTGYAASLIGGLLVRIEGELRAGTQSDNEPARALYKSMGFKVEKRERSFHK